MARKISQTLSFGYFFKNKYESLDSFYYVEIKKKNLLSYIFFLFRCKTGQIGMILTGCDKKIFSKVIKDIKVRFFLILTKNPLKNDSANFYSIIRVGMFLNKIPHRQEHTFLIFFVYIYSYLFTLFEVQYHLRGRKPQ